MSSLIMPVLSPWCSASMPIPLSKPVGFKSNAVGERGSHGRARLPPSLALVRQEPLPPGTINTAARPKDVHVQLLSSIGFACSLMFEHGCYERRPARLVIGTQPAPSIRVEILVKQHQVFPMRIVSISLIRAVTWLYSLLVLLEKQD